MKNIIPLAIIMLLLSSCNKDFEERNVSYQIKGLATPYKIAYMDEKGETNVITHTPSGVGEWWKYNFTAQQGDPVYLSTEFYEQISNTTFQFRILIDGKVYKDSYGYEFNQGDTLFRVIRSGVVPY